MNARPRLLFLAQTLPYPPDGGVNIRTYNILRLLSTVFEIDLVCFYRAGIARDVEQSRRALASIVRSVEVFPISQETSRIRFVADHVRSVATHSVYTRFAYRNKPCWTYLKSLLAARKPQLVHVDSLDLSAYLPLFDGIAVACTHHNIESALLDRRATAERNALRSAYLRHQASLMKREEQAYAPEIALNVVCSRFDQTTLANIAPGARSIVVPNGVDTSVFSTEKPIQNGVVSVGGTTWYPNRDGLEYFSAEIQPQIQRRQKSPVTWVGRCRATEIARYAKNGITLTGYVDSVQPYVHGAKCFVAPLRVGGGTRLKLVDAWAMGAAIVSTPIAAEGLNAVDGDNMLIRESPSDFAEAVCEVINDDSMRRKLELASRLTAEEYDWRRISKEMLQVYRNLADRE